MTIISKDEKKYLDNYKRTKILSEIIDSILKKPLSISEISRRLNLNRSTMRYYLSLLREDGKILYERKNNLPGRPTLVRINEKHFKELHKKMSNQANEYYKKMENSKLKLKILELLKSKREMTLIEIHDELKKENPNLNMISDVISMLQYLESSKRVKNVWKLRNKLSTHKK